MLRSENPSWSNLFYRLSLHLISKNAVTIENTPIVIWTDRPHGATSEESNMPPSSMKDVAVGESSSVKAAMTPGTFRFTMEGFFPSGGRRPKRVRTAAVAVSPTKTETKATSPVPNPATKEVRPKQSSL